MGTQRTVYRVDTFTVLPSARDEFLTNVHRTHAQLRALPGFDHDLILEKPSDDGVVIMTLAAWEDADALASAREAMQRRHRQDGFDPKALIDRLSITADLAEYTEAE